MDRVKVPPLCECNCGGFVTWNEKKKCWNRFIYCHRVRVNNPMKRPEVRAKHLDAMNTTSMKTKKSKMMKKNNPMYNPEVVLKVSIAQMKCRTDGYCDAWGDKEYKDDLLKDRCERCGVELEYVKGKDGRIRPNLELHHIDEDKQNCHPDNLETDCKSCHRKIHIERTWINH